MFIGREEECKQLKDFLEDNESKAALIYGVRRIGKTSLIRESIKNLENSIYYECLESSYAENMKQLSAMFAVKLNIPGLFFDNILDLLRFAASAGNPFVLILDEYQFLKASFKDGELDSYLKSAIDSFPNGSNKIILSGSSIGIMKELLEYENPLFGRFNLVIDLKPFDYKTASLFYPERTSKEKIELYSILGGSPYVLSTVRKQNLEAIIKESIIKQTGLIRTFLEYVAFMEIKKSRFSYEILTAIGNGKLRFSEILSRIPGITSANLSQQLNALISLEIIEKVSHINSRNDSRKTFYTIADNLIRFFFSYIHTNRSAITRIGEESFYSMYIRPSINTFISYRFEGIARAYFSLEVKAGRITDIMDIGTYWYDDRKHHSNGEFDCVLKHPDNSYDVFEVKYLSSPMRIEMMDDEKKKISQIENLKLKSIGFVSASGFEKVNYDAILITGDELFL